MVESRNAQPGDGNVPLPPNAANYTSLSPLSFLSRAAEVYPDQLAIAHTNQQLTWGDVYSRCKTAAARMHALGIETGDVVAVVAPNIPALFEMHYSVPMCGGILNAINTRLEASTISYILQHGGAKLVFVDRDSTATVRQALELMKAATETDKDATTVLPKLICIDDVEASGDPISDVTYEEFVDDKSSSSKKSLLPTIDPSWQWQLPADEWQSISLNYTSGTTGNPKGVVYHHRGAMLNAVSNITGWEMPMHPVYLWTLPMFHCNGWCFPWTLAANAGTSICTRKIDAAVIYEAIASHGVTHFCGAPIILNFIINASDDEIKPLPHTVKVMTAAAPPPASVLSAIEKLGFDITHVYGLTETYGPAVICAWKPQWNALADDERANLKSRQGVRYQVLEGLDVMDPDTMTPVPRDGTTIGEIMFRGNIVMRGYYKNQSANDESFRGGWFHSGDLAVMDSDGYLRILDRAKDIIISGGENISSIEIENTLHAHPDVLDVAVAAKADDHWGEVPCAFVERKTGATLTEQELIDWCRERLAHFKCPKHVVFRDLPKTSTGKIQKFQLRDWTDEI